jgi:hypothetical protein
MENFEIVKDHPKMLEYIDFLQKKNAEALSFYPKQVFEREVANGRIYLAILNNEPCGYLYIGAGGGDVKCHQVCIQYDARRRLYGAMLVAALENYAQLSGSDCITLRCGFDLDANKFWQEMGYGCIIVQDGGVRRMRKINVWRKYLKKSLFEYEFIEPVSGKTDASIWRRNKVSGTVTQFIRGKKMSDYRLKLIEADSVPKALIL